MLVVHGCRKKTIAEKTHGSGIRGFKFIKVFWRSIKKNTRSEKRCDKLTGRFASELIPDQLTRHYNSSGIVKIGQWSVKTVNRLRKSALIYSLYVSIQYCVLWYCMGSFPVCPKRWLLMVEAISNQYFDRFWFLFSTLEWLFSHQQRRIFSARTNRECSPLYSIVTTSSDNTLFFKSRYTGELTHCPIIIFTKFQYPWILNMRGQIPQRYLMFCRNIYNSL